MPAVHAKSLLRIVQAVWPRHLVQTRVGSGKRLILVCLLVLEIVGPAKIILRARAIDRREFLVSIHIKLDFTLAPPAIVVHTNCHKGSHIMTFPLDIVYNGIKCPLCRMIPSE